MSLTLTFKLLCRQNPMVLLLQWILFPKAFAMCIYFLKGFYKKNFDLFCGSVNIKESVNIICNVLLVPFMQILIGNLHYILVFTGMLNFLIARRLFPAALTLLVNSCLWLGVNSNFIKRLDQSLRRTTSTQHRLLQTHYSAVHAV